MRCRCFKENGGKILGRTGKSTITNIEVSINGWFGDTPRAGWFMLENPIVGDDDWETSKVKAKAGHLMAGPQVTMGVAILKHANMI